MISVAPLDQLNLMVHHWQRPV